MRMKGTCLTAAVLVLSLMTFGSRTEDTSNPILTWNTFMGAGGDESAASVVLDSSGNIYIAGYSNATWGSPVRAYTGDYDAFIAKFSPNGHFSGTPFSAGR